MQQATSAYLEAEDGISAWIEDSCDLDKNNFEATTLLYQSWKKWAERAGEYTGPTKAFVHRLEARGLHPKRNKSARGFEGISLKLPLIPDQKEDPL